jgi:hypothetical protein
MLRMSDYSSYDYDSECKWCGARLGMVLYGPGADECQRCAAGLTPVEPKKLPSLDEWARQTRLALAGGAK